MANIVFYGDSNTYGYDARDFFGGRFSEKERWVSLVAKELGTGFNVIEEGLNGRRLPDIAIEESYLTHMTERLTYGDYFVIMLGTNDILHESHPDAKAAAHKMGRLLEWVSVPAFSQGFSVIVIAPVPIADSPEYHDHHEQSLILNTAYEKLCAEYGAVFMNADSWNVSLACDGVHFSEEGHSAFAEGFLRMFHNHSPKK